MARVSIPDLVDHVFEPFVSTKRGGSGLGLALVAKIVADHGGVIEYERVGRTACARIFRVLLPVARRGPAMTATIIIADDDAAIRTVVRQAMQRAGYQVR